MNEYAIIRNSYQFVDSQCEIFSYNEQSVKKPEVLSELRDDLVAVIITGDDVMDPLKIQKSLKDIGISSDIIFELDEFILHEKTTLNYPSGVL